MSDVINNNYLRCFKEAFTKFGIEFSYIEPHLEDYFQETFSSLQNEYEDIVDYVDDLEKEVVRLEGVVDDLKDEVGSHEAIASDLEVHGMHLEDDIVELNNKVADLEGELNNLRLEYDILHSDHQRSLR